MVDGEIESALVVTLETIYETQRDGTMVAKQVWVSLDTPNPKVTTIEKSPEMPALEYEPVDMSSPQLERTHTYQVSIYHK